MREALERLPSVESVIVVPYLEGAPHLDGLPLAKTLRDAIAPYPAGEIEFRQLPFAHPLYILFSSGTTGTPKCIVHGAGGTLLQHLKEHILHTDVRPGDRVFYATTLGWMMWNWLASTLAAGATALLYEGSVSHPGMDALFDFADESGMTHFGTSAKYIDAVKKSGLAPRESHDLGPLRAMMSTGSPLVPESFDFVYSSIKRDLCLSSISGGTDIVSCFVLGNPTAPVRRGEIQAFGLGMDVRVYDDGGRPVTGEKGELVCARPFPAMPVKFWNDPDGARYRGAYFERFPDVWCHGDYAEITEHGGTVIYGRSDAVLNPGGVQDRHRRDLPPGRAVGRNRGRTRHRPGLGRRRARRAVRQAGSGVRAGRRARGPDQGPGPQGRLAAPHARAHRRSAGHPAHQERQDRRACRALDRARRRGQEHRGARQPRGAGPFPRPGRARHLKENRMSKDYKALAGEVDARAGNLFRAAPDQMRAFRDLMGAASKDGALDAKTKELMAIAIAVATRCEGCIVFHVRSAIKHGASREELADTIGVAIEMGGGPAAVYGADALAAFDQFQAG